MEILLLIPGFILLIGGAEWLITGSHSIARRLGLSEMLIGLTIVAFGTSLPELIVNLFSQSSGNSGLAAGNVIGSNITNTLLILGASAIVRTLVVHRDVVYREAVFNVLLSAMVLIMVLDTTLSVNAGWRGLDTIDGLVLLSYFFGFMYYIVHNARNNKDIASKSDIAALETPNRSIFKVFFGLVGLMVGGQFIVNGATEFAQTLGASDALIGATIVAVGTSIPELVTSVLAVRKGMVDIAVGNVVGSNLFNLMMVLGVSAVVGPIPFNAELTTDTLTMLAVSLIFFMVMTVGKHKHEISRFEGAWFLALYVAYIGWAVWESVVLFG